MSLTSASLAKFQSGQVQIQNREQGFIFWGEAKAVFILRGRLHIEFEWVARGQGFPPLPRDWVSDFRRAYSLRVRGCKVTPIPETEQIMLRPKDVGDIVIFYPFGCSYRLDPAQVKGLQLAPPVYVM